MTAVGDGPIWGNDFGIVAGPEILKIRGMMLRFFAPAFFVFALLAAGCGSKMHAPESERLPATHWFGMKLGEKEIRMQLVVTRQEMSRGLMQRTELGENDGMLFPYSTPRRMSFWMKNTPLPLDIGFFDADGVLREVYPLYPYDESAVESRSDRIQFALEMNQGWFKRNEIRPGTPLDLNLLAAALDARGFDPTSFGIFHWTSEDADSENLVP